jgi:hypothetical protein
VSELIGILLCLTGKQNSYTVLILKRMPSLKIKLIKFRPYTRRFGGVHYFKPIDASQRIQFFNWMTKNVDHRLVIPQLLFITDEAYFHVTGYVNSQNI